MAELLEKDATWLLAAALLAMVLMLMRLLPYLTRLRQGNGRAEPGPPYERRDGLVPLQHQVEELEECAQETKGMAAKNTARIGEIERTMATRADVAGLHQRLDTMQQGIYRHVDEQFDRMTKRLDRLHDGRQR